MFEAWLNKKAGEVFDKVGREEPIRPDEMMILVLKAQANHFMHLDTDLRKDTRDLREDMDKRFIRTQWLVGLGIALLVALMSFYRFFQ